MRFPIYAFSYGAFYFIATQWIAPGISGLRAMAIMSLGIAWGEIYDWVRKGEE